MKKTEWIVSGAIAIWLIMIFVILAKGVPKAHADRQPVGWAKWEISGHYDSVVRFHDDDNAVTCYEVESGSTSPAISCVPDPNR